MTTTATIPTHETTNRRLTALVILAAVVMPALLVNRSAMPARSVTSPARADSGEQFVEEIQRRAVLFFVEQSDPVTGLVRDRAPANGGTKFVPASVAATGFALTAWCIADERGWLPAGEAKERTRRTLKFVAEHVAHERGWLYHFVDPKTGKRSWHCEASTIDTALFLSGALAAREYFDDAEIRERVNFIYSRIDWKWAMNGGTTLTHGWRPETGFIRWRWEAYSELMGLYLLGIGAKENGLSADTWQAWRRGPMTTYGGRTFIDAGPLFTHQYAHAWFDFRGRHDGHANYWENSVAATLAQRDWSAEQAGRFPLWSTDLWGLTASDSAHGYVAWGGPSGDAAHAADGTVVPCAPGGSLPFAPRECVAALERMKEVGGDRVWRRYGFVDAFNPQTGWTSPDVIGIDLGITLLMAENLRSGFVWRVFMKAPEVRRGMELAGFHDEVPHKMLAGTFATINPLSGKR